MSPTSGSDSATGPALGSRSSAAASPADPKQLRRVAFASLIGTLISGYDYVLYGLAAALVFPKVFFPSLGAAAGITVSLATVGVAFVVRPFGAILFGHYGDRLGRKRMLVISIVGIGLGTALMGVVPSAETIGVAAPILIVLLRAVQGIAIGGEWAGSVLFATEHAPSGRRGFYAMFPQIGHSLPVALSAATFLVVNLSVSPETFLSWGWRVPFLASGALLVVGLWIRLTVEETPVFEKAQRQDTATKIPFVDAFKTQPGTIFRCAGLALMTITLIAVGTSFVANYAVETIGFTHTQTLAVTALAGLVYTAFTILGAVLSDRVGRRPVIGWAAAVGAVWALLLFPLINTGSFAVYLLAMCVTFGIAGMPFGVVAAFIPEQFHTRFRFSAAGFAYNATAVVGGGVVPLIAPPIVGAGGTMVFGIVLAAFVLVSAIAAFSLKETRDSSLDW